MVLHTAVVPVIKTAVGTKSKILISQNLYDFGKTVENLDLLK